MEGKLFVQVQLVLGGVVPSGRRLPPQTVALPLFRR